MVSVALLRIWSPLFYKKLRLRTRKMPWCDHVRGRESVFTGTLWSDLEHSGLHNINKDTELILQLHRDFTDITILEVSLFGQFV